MPILGTIYAYATWYIPIIYVNFLITFGLGLVSLCSEPFSHQIRKSAQLWAFGTFCYYCFIGCLLQPMGSMGRLSAKRRRGLGNKQ